MTWMKENYFLSLFVAGSIAFILFVIMTKSFGSEEGLHINIEQGDSLWDLAHEYANDEDEQVWIKKVIAMNNLKDGHIRAGEMLEIPANVKEYDFNHETEIAGDTQ